MNSIYQAITELEKNNESATLCTVVKSEGSTPRHVGSKMLVYPDGKFIGTVGGGELENRVALGEPKCQVYRSMVAESLMIGLAGSVAGTLLGLAVARYLQVHGFDVGFLLKNSSMMISDVLRARVTPTSAAIGFVPGLGATLLGTLV